MPFFKDRNGPLQYLLLPTTKIAGIESNEILSPDSVNYFYRAWEARAHMEKLYKGTIPEEEVSLTLNSQLGRSQNQFHIHISCTRTDIKELLQQNAAAISTSWSLFPGGVLGHKYFARRINMKELKDGNILQLLAKNLPEAKDHMNEFGLAVVASKNASGATEFIVLADRADLASADKGHIEEIQDHTCAQLKF